MKLYRNHYRYRDYKSEGEFENSLSLILKFSNANLVSQLNAGDGRADLAFTIGEHAFILEIKFNSSSDDAIDQIINKKYYLASLFDHHKRVQLLGINYLSSLKTIESVKHAIYTKDQGVKFYAKYSVQSNPENQLLDVTSRDT